MQRLLNFPCVAVAALLLSVASPAVAQRLLDLPVRAWAGADATVRGAAAVFWNPAAIAPMGQIEAVVFDVLAPDPTGLEGFAAAASFHVDSATVVAVGWHHVGVDGILRTTDSPLVEDATPLDLGEDAFALAASRSIGEILQAGVMARYVHASEIAEDRAVVEFGGGILLTPSMRFRPVFGAAVRAEREGAAWTAGLDVTPFGRPGDVWQAGASWGMDSGPLRIGTTHRLSINGAWRDYVQLSVGAAGEPGVEGRTWTPIGGATLRLSRYALGILREEMPNDFGASHAFRFSVRF